MFSPLLLVALLGALSAPTQSAPPPLPTLALDSYPPAAREAIARTHREAASHPPDGQKAGALGRVLQAWEQWDAAHGAYRRAQALAPGTFEWHYLDAVVLQRQARPADAAAQLEAALKVSPTYLPAQIKLAESLLDAGKLDESQQRFTALTNPDAAPAAAFGLGRIAATQGRHAAAVEHFQRAIALFPEFGSAHYALALSYRALGRRDEAQAALERHYRAVVALGVNVADAHYDFGVLLGMQQRWDDAAEAYRRALALNPLHAEAHNNLGQLLERTRQFEPAAAEYRLALDSQPTLRVARFNLGRMLIALGRPDEASAELQKLTEPRDAEAPRYLFALSAAHVRAGRKSEGLKWATEARDLALKFGDTALAAAIERDMATIR
jgi:tetratricopeptide (TPR) repeat protein